MTFAICPGDGEATPVRCPGGAGDVCTAAAEPADEGAGDVARTVAGELAGDAAAAVGGELPGDPAGAVPGELAGADGGLAFAGASAGELETAAP